MRYRIVFFGTGEFACPSIELIANHHNLVACVSSAKPCPSKDLARKLGIKIFDPIDPNVDEFIEVLKTLAPEMLILADYGYILSKELLGVPSIVSIGLHPSLLPAYRGAAPIQWVILNGESYTGITTFIMDPRIDHGNMLMQEQVEILPLETHGELEGRLAKIGARVMLETIDRFRELLPILQPKVVNGMSYARKIGKELRKINWSFPANEIVNLVRALSPIPAAFTIFRDRRLEILKAILSDKRSDVIIKKGAPGAIMIEKNRLLIGAGGRCVEVLIVKPEGKREQTAIDFINGYRPRVGESME
ncbi:MAG: hypothetical protein HY769_08440 [Candidatus Stahlbacteria bacterium]|nr:hypothetical protein [Candidatus Stahlbacteria bacterium]